MTALAVLILGMHRSGTSAMAGALSLAGVNLGTHLTPGRPENPKGFFEDDRVWQIHEKLLADLGVPSGEARRLPEGWQGSAPARQAQDKLVAVLAEEFKAAPLWGVKDPRLCRTLPIWPEVCARLGAEPRIVLAVRSPQECVSSLRRRDGLAPAHARALWLRYTLEAEQASRATPRVIVCYAALLDDSTASLVRIDQALGLGLDVRIEAARPQLSSFLDPALRHEHAVPEPPANSSAPLAALCERATRALLALPEPSAEAELGEIGAHFAEMERVAEAFTAPLAWRASQARALATELSEQKAKLARTEAERVRLEEALAALHASRSWRLTAPLRALASRLRVR